MLRVILPSLLLAFCGNQSIGQQTTLPNGKVNEFRIIPEKISIVRDSFGVPHIFAPTDAEVAYGLAWAHAEDDFTTIQTLLLNAKGRLGAYLGKQGAAVDYVYGLLNTKATAAAQLEKMDPAFLRLINGYLMGLESYAKHHPEKLIYKDLFPLSLEEYLGAATFSIAVFCGVDRVLPSILNNTIATLPGFSGEGSNAFAIHSSRSATNENMLVINAHQPIEGPTAFYEAHLNSEEGWNIVGGLFPGAPLIFHGVNPHLGWAHTVNNPDKIDVYQLQTDKKHKGKYKVDGEWLTLEKRKIRLRIKGIPFPVSKKAYLSIYGPTVRNDAGNYFALRLPAIMDAAALQQWYAMNKAKGFTEFYSALRQQHLAMFNIVYADNKDTIFYISNGLIPLRNADTSLRWNSTLPGNTKATLWSTLKPIEALPQYVNPKSGYLFNTNHSPFLASEEKDNLPASSFDRNDGFELFDNNRSLRAKEMIGALQKISYEDLKRIKFDRQMPERIIYPYGYRSDSLWMMEETSMPDSLRNLLRVLKTWDRKAGPESKGAAAFLLAYHTVPQVMSNRNGAPLTKTQAIEVVKRVHTHLTQHFGSTDVSLGEVQKLIRGKEEWPQGGLPDVLAAVSTSPYEQGKRKMTSGDAYIALVRFPANGGLPKIETINTFGASNNANDPHFADQRPLYQAQQLKPMTLDKNEILKKSKKIYSPK